MVMKTSRLLLSKGNNVEKPNHIAHTPAFITSRNKNNKKLAALLRSKDGNQETTTKTRV
jgi:hypothetical protein